MQHLGRTGDRHERVLAAGGGQRSIGRGARGSGDRASRASRACDYVKCGGTAVERQLAGGGIDRGRDSVHANLGIELVDQRLAAEAGRAAAHRGGHRGAGELEGKGLRAGRQERAAPQVHRSAADEVGSAAAHRAGADAQTVGIHAVGVAAQIDGHVAVGQNARTAADIDAQELIEASADGARRQSDVGSLARNFGQQRLVFVVQRGAVARERARSRLGCQRLEPVQNVRNVVEAAIDDLQNADTVVGVPNALL